MRARAFDVLCAVAKGRNKDLSLIALRIAEETLEGNENHAV